MPRQCNALPLSAWWLFRRPENPVPALTPTGIVCVRQVQIEPAHFSDQRHRALLARPIQELLTAAIDRWGDLEAQRDDLVETIEWELEMNDGESEGEEEEEEEEGDDDNAGVKSAEEELEIVRIKEHVSLLALSGDVFVWPFFAFFAKCFRAGVRKTLSRNTVGARW